MNEFIKGRQRVQRVWINQGCVTSFRSDSDVSQADYHTAYEMDNDMHLSRHRKIFDSMATCKVVNVTTSFILKLCCNQGACLQKFLHVRN